MTPTEATGTPITLRRIRLRWPRRGSATWQVARVLAVTRPRTATRAAFADLVAPAGYLAADADEVGYLADDDQVAVAVPIAAVDAQRRLALDRARDPGRRPANRVCVVEPDRPAAGSDTEYFRLLVGAPVPAAARWGAGVRCVRGAGVTSGLEPGPGRTEAVGPPEPATVPTCHTAGMRERRPAPGPAGSTTDLAGADDHRGSRDTARLAAGGADHPGRRWYRRTRASPSCRSTRLDPTPDQRAARRRGDDSCARGPATG